MKIILIFHREPFKFIFSVESFSFDCQIPEPLFCRVAIYDLKSQKKLSEDFEFEFNSKEQLSMLPESYKAELSNRRKKMIYQQPKCAFFVENPHTEIVLVLWVERIFHGDITEAWKTYKEEAKTDKLAKKLKEKSDFMFRTRQPFLFGFKHLFILDGSKIEIKEGTVQIQDLYRVPETGIKKPFSIYEAVNDEKGLLSEKNQLNCSFKFFINHATFDKFDQFSIEYNESKNKVQRDKFKFYKKSSKFHIDEKVFEYFDVVQSFPPIYHTLSFNNTFYLYPETVSINTGMFSTFSNVIINICYKDNDKPHGPRSKRILIGNEYYSQYWTSVTYNQKNPQFFDEVKIDFIPPFNESQNVLFEFYHVSNAKASTDVEEGLGKVQLTLAGYSFLALSSVPEEGSKFTLKVYSNIKDGYLTSTNLPEIKGSSFEVGIKLFSSVCSHNKDISTLFNLVDDQKKVTDEKKSKTNSNPKKYYQNAGYIDKFFKEKKLDFTFTPNETTNYEEVYNKFPLIMRVLCSLSSSIYYLYPKDVQDGEGELIEEYTKFKDFTREQVKNYSYTMFEQMTRLLLGVEDVDKIYGRMNPSINSFIHNHFKNPKEIPKPFFILFLQVWTYFIQKSDKETNVEKDFIFEESAKTNNLSIKKDKRKSKEKTEAPKLDYTKLPPKLTYAHSFGTSWVFFDIIVKSMITYSQTDLFTKDFPKECVNSKEFYEVFDEFLDALVPKLLFCLEKQSTNPNLANVASYTNCQLSLFICDILPLLTNKKDVIRKYCSLLSEKKSAESLNLRLHFFEILTDKKILISVSDLCPSEYGETLFHSLSLPDTPKQNNKTIREKALYVLFNLLTKYDYDVLFKDKRSFIANFHLDFITKVFIGSNDLFNVIDDIKYCEKLITCFFSIIKNADSDKVSDILKKHKCKAASGLANILLISTLICRSIEHFEKKFKKLFSTILFEILCKHMVEDYLKPAYDDIFGEKPSREYSLSEFLETFEKVAKTFSGIGLTEYPLPVKVNTPQNVPQNNVFKKQFFEYYLSFTSKFRAVILKCVEYKNHRSFTLTGLANQTREATPWNVLLASVLLNSFIPVSISHESVSKCLTLLLEIPKKLPQEEEKDKMVKIEVNKKEQDIKEQETDDDEIELDPKDKKIIYASLERLVERLTKPNPGYQGLEFYKIFFLTYLSFTTPKQLLVHFRNLLNKMIKDGEGKITKENKEYVLLVKVLQHWIKEHFDDLDQQCIIDFIQFLDEIGNTPTGNLPSDKIDFKQSLRPIVLALSKELLIVESSAKRTLKQFKPPILPNNFEELKSKKFSIFQYDSEEIARQMTLIDFGLYSKIHHSEFFGKEKNWDKGTREMKLAKAKYITLCTERINNLTKWFAAMILKENDIKERGNIILKLLDIAKYLRQFNNFFGLYSIVGTFTLNPIDKLKKTWEEADKISKREIGKSYEEYRSYAELLSPKNQYAEFKNTLMTVVPPCIPDMKMYLGALTMIEGKDNGKVKNGKTLINFHKRILYSEQIQQVRLFQQQHYEFEPVPFLMEQLGTGGGYFSEPQMNDDDEWALYQKLEHNK